MDDAEDAAQAAEWESLYEKVRTCLQQFGTEDYLGRADFHILADNYGFRTINVAFHKLEMLRVPIIRRLQSLLRDHPSWEVLIAVDIPGKEREWPSMGLTVRPGEIVDKLQRQYLPRELQSLSFATA
jgi:hypothetical protein